VIFAASTFKVASASFLIKTTSILWRMYLSAILYIFDEKYKFRIMFSLKNKSVIITFWVRLYDAK
jgi:hypothetical protein